MHQFSSKKEIKSRTPAIKTSSARFLSLPSPTHPPTSAHRQVAYQGARIKQGTGNRPLRSLGLVWQARVAPVLQTHERVAATHQACGVRSQAPVRAFVQWSERLVPL